MRTRFAGNSLALLLLAASIPATAAVTVDRLQLEMGRLDGEVLLRKDPDDKSSFAVTVVDPANGKRMPGRIEVKGAFTRVLNKKGVLIKLAPGNKWHGTSRISLNAMGTDNSHMREWLSWKLMKALRMTVPEADYVRLALNGRDLGTYIRIEWLDGAVFERHGLGKAGDFFQPLDATYCGNLSAESIEDPAECWRKIVSSDGYGPLQSLVQDITQATPVSIERLVDTEFDPESLVNWLAVNALVSDGDVYNKNYFLFRPQKLGGHRWVVVPFDYDISFGRTYDPYQKEPYTILNSNFSYFYPLALGAPNPLRAKAVMNERLGARIRARIGELIDGDPDAQHPWRGWFEPGRMDARIDELYKVLLPQIDADQVLAGDRARFTEEVEAVRHYVRARVQYLKRVIVGHAVNDPGRAVVRLPQSHAIAYFTDGLGMLLGYVRTGGASDVTATLETERGQPELLPPGIAAQACVQRAWRLTMSGSGARPRADLTLEYRQETSRSHDLGAAIGDEHRLVLYRRDEGRDTKWQALPTETNAIANTLTVKGTVLPAGTAWFAACVPTATLEASAAQ